MSSPEHPWTSISRELATWLDEESKWYASALKGEYASPFAANASESEKLDYYRRQFFIQEPDGTLNYDKPNTEGRKALIERIGIDQYAEVAKAVSPGKTEANIPEFSKEY